MATLNVMFDASTSPRFPVYSHYAGQIYPQPAYLELDIRDGSLIADYSGEVGNAAPSAVWHSLVLRFKLAPETTAGQIEKIISDNKELFQSIMDGSESHWDGRNWVGKFSEAAQDSIDNIIQTDAFMRDLEGGMIDLAQWIEDKPFPADGQTLEQFAQGLIDSDGQNGYHFREQYHVDSMLSDLRDIWADMLYSGKDIPVIVAKHLIEHGTCDDSQWMDELREFANAE